MATFRYLKWVLYQDKGATEIQVAEFEPRLSASTVSWPTTPTTTNPGGANTGDVPANLTDANTGTKALDNLFKSASPRTVIVIDAQSAQGFDAYRYRTGNDETGRDPISWTVHGSNTSSNWFDSSWTLLDTRTSETITASRDTWTSDYSLAGGAVSYRYIKWSITAVTSGDLTQADDFELRSSSSSVSWPGGTVTFNPGGSNAVGNSEGANKLVDNSTATKWLDANTSSNHAVYLGTSTFIIDCTSGNNVTFDSYRWCTGNDEETRDPVSWEFYGSNDGASYTLLDARVNQTITASRTTFTSDYTITEPPSGSGGGPLAGGQLTGGILAGGRLAH